MQNKQTMFSFLRPDFCPFFYPFFCRFCQAHPIHPKQHLCQNCKAEIRLRATLKTTGASGASSGDAFDPLVLPRYYHLTYQNHEGSAVRQWITTIKQFPTQALLQSVFCELQWPENFWENLRSLNQIILIPQLSARGNRVPHFLTKCLKDYLNLHHSIDDVQIWNGLSLRSDLPTSYSRGNIQLQKFRSREQRFLYSPSVQVSRKEAWGESIQLGSKNVCVLVDDVSTTGATFLSTKRAIQDHFPSAAFHWALWSLAHSPVHSPFSQTNQKESPRKCRL